MHSARRLRLLALCSTSLLACEHAPDRIAPGNPRDQDRPFVAQKNEDLEIAGDPVKPRPKPNVIATDAAQQPMASGFPAPDWVSQSSGAELGPSPSFYGVGAHPERKYAEARSVHTLDSEWRSFIRLLNLELYGDDLEKGGRLPLPPWSGEGLPRAGVTFPDQWVGKGQVHVRARVSLDTVLAPLAKIANAPDFDALARKVHARLVQRGSKDAVDLPWEPLSVLQVATGPLHTCAVLADHSVACWGAGTTGQLGIAIGEQHAPIPRKVPGLSNIKSVAIGGSSTCAVTNAGDVFCWGEDKHGIVGGAGMEKTTEPPLTVYSSKPVPIKGLSQIVEVALSDMHACALDRSGSVFCWGAGYHGALGFPVGKLVKNTHPDGSVSIDLENPIVRIPQKVPKLERVKHLAAGSFLTCAVTADGRVRCFGQVPGSFGGKEIKGDACGANCVFTPTEIEGIRSAEDIVLGPSYGCALLSNGEVSCWGTASRGQLARECNAPCAPEAVYGVKGAKSLSAGPFVVCAVSGQGETTCWGNGEILGQTKEVEGPTLMDLPREAVEVDVGFSTCVRLKSGSISCWGRNLGGEIGDGTTLPLTKPYQVRFLGKARKK